jgi:hypothetical protein
MSDDHSWDHDWPHPFLNRTMAHLRTAVLASIVAAVGWISFTLLYVAFWAHGFSLFQSIVVIVVSLLVLAGAMGVTWVTLGIRWSHHAFD